MFKINSEEISVVVQGAIDKNETEKCLNSIRKWLPNAEIILSTWEKSNISNLNGLYDIAIFNTDPGAVYFEKTKTYHNINRQIISTKAGLEKVSRKYTLKLRSDLVLTSDNFLKFWDSYQKMIEDYKLFEHKVIVPATFTRYKYRQNSIPTPFQVSDWWLFGLSKDIKKYFGSIDIVQEPDFSKYFELNKKESYLGKNYPARFTPEQYFCLSAFRQKFKDIWMDNLMNFNEELVNKSRIAIPNNFIVLEYSQHEIYCPKHPESKDEKLFGESYCTLYNSIVYNSEYKKFIDKEYIFNSKELNTLNSELNQSYLKLYKHIGIIKSSNASALLKLENLILSVPICLAKYIIIFIKNNLRNTKKC